MFRGIPVHVPKVHVEAPKVLIEVPRDTVKVPETHVEVAKVAVEVLDNVPIKAPEVHIATPRGTVNVAAATTPQVQSPPDGDQSFMAPVDTTILARQLGSKEYHLCKIIAANNANTAVNVRWYSNNFTEWYKRENNI